MFCAETVTGYVGQILDECEIDEKARKLLTELYSIALKELTIADINITAVYDTAQKISIPCKLNTKTKEVFDIKMPDVVKSFDFFFGFYLNINNKTHPIRPKSKAKPDDYWYFDK